MTSFVQKFGSAAIAAAAGSTIFPETILTAAALESGYGKSKLSSQYNNFFGIKADSSWKGKSVVFATKEQDKNGKVFTVNAKFRHYDTVEESFRNYVKFISGPRYVKAGVTTAATVEKQFMAIKAGGYATDVSYVNKLKSIFNSVQDWASKNPGDAGAGVATILFIFAGFFF